MVNHLNRNRLFVRVGLLVFLIVVVCLGIFYLFQRLSPS
jgi:hypothetical protein